MGTWGTAILDDDTALDVAGEFKDAIAYGKTIEEAEDQLIEDFCIDDEEEDIFGQHPPFWLGLAAQQVKLGRLSERTKANALRIIDEGIDIAIWQQNSPKDVKKRQAALDKLRAQIVGPQKEPTKVRKPFIDNIEWEEGDGLAYQLPSGKWIALRVRKVVREPRNQEALYDVLDVLQDEQPSPECFMQAEVKLSPFAIKQLKDIAADVRERNNLYLNKGEPLPEPGKFERTIALQTLRALDRSSFWMSRLSSKEQPPRPLIKVISHMITEPTLDCPGFYPKENWKQLDQLLKRVYGLE